MSEIGVQLLDWCGGVGEAVAAVDTAAPGESGSHKIPLICIIHTLYTC